MAALSRSRTRQWPQWPFYQAEAEIPRSSQTIFIKSLQNCNFIKAGQPQWPFCQASEGRVACARFRNFGAGSWPVASRNNFPDDGRSFRDSHGKPAPSHAHAPLFWRWAGPSGFPKQFSGRRPKLLRQPPSRSLPSFWRWGGRTGFPKLVSER